MTTIRARASMEAGSIFYYIAFACQCLSSSLVTTTAQHVGFMEVSSIEIILQVACVMALGVKMLFQRYTFSSMSTALCLSLLVVVSAVACKSYELLWIVLFTATAQGVRIRPLAAIAAITSAVILVFAVLGSITGAIPTIYGGRDGVLGVRSSMGFSHPNYFGKAILKLCMAWMVLRYPKVTIYDALLFALGFFVTLEVADSRTAATGILLMFVVLVVVKLALCKLRKRAVLCCFLTLLVFAACVSYYFMVFYDSSNVLHRLLNDLLSGRLYYAHHYFEAYSPSMMGTDFSKAPVVYAASGSVTSNFVVDNAFCRIVIRYGYLSSALFLVGLFLVFRKALKEDDLGVCVVGLTICVLLGFSERYMLDVGFNYFLIAFAALLYSKPLASLDVRRSVQRSFES